jgi:MacB-like periplasmic core domain
MVNEDGEHTLEMTWRPWAFIGILSLLGVAPLFGRTISDEDDRPKGPPVAGLSYRAWQEQLGGDRRGIGRAIQLDERPYEIVGVMPAGFRSDGVSGRGAPVKYLSYSVSLVAASIVPPARGGTKHLV